MAESNNDIGEIYISLERALELLEENIETNSYCELPILDAINCVIAEDVFSPVNLPLFTNSSMDGFAVNTSSISEVPAILEIIGEVKAGSSKKLKIRGNSCIKVYTGSPIPENADAVIPIESVESENNYIKIFKKPQKGENIRKEGEEIKKGEKVLERGTVVSPSVCAFLAAMGLTKIKVYKKPKILIITTGSEIIKPGKKNKFGQVFNANAIFLQSALKAFNISFRYFHVKDNFEKLNKAFNQNWQEYDIIVFTGGISMGDYDMVKYLVESQKIKRIFYKVKQKPGKPLFFGKKEGRYIFAFPGNPAAVVTCYYEYLLPAIKKMMGYSHFFPITQTKILLNDIKKNPERKYLMRGKIVGDYVMALPNQESHMLSSFALTDAFILADEGVSFLPKNTEVKVHIIRNEW